MIDCESKETYVICGATDMRKGINGLATIASLHLTGSSFESAMFIFCNKSRNKVKIIAWDGDGFWLYQERLERGTFPWPADGAKVKRITIMKKELPLTEIIDCIEKVTAHEGEAIEMTWFPPL